MTHETSSYVWRQRTKFEATLAFSIMEPWERILSMIIYTFFAILLVSGLYHYLPHHVSIMCQRAIYYLWGEAGHKSLVSAAL
ncbi:hypothetical protein EV363DRAFT_871857 [Boletus edulis]|nr:hypothetical protein EV363DRAFT_871857 [Boletus edulis]